MDEKRLAQLIKDQRPMPDPAFDAQIDARARQLVREEIKMKKKISVLAVCVALILSLALFGAVAEFMGLNLFEIFGRQDERLAQLAPEAALPEISPVNIINQSTEEASTAAITSAYYDGQSLMVGYLIENGNRLEAFTPTADQLSRMEKDSNPPIIMITDPQTEGLIRQWNEAVQASKPFGFIQRSLSVSDHTTTNDGLDLPASSENQQPGDGQTLYALREYESPLPQAAQNQELLKIEIGLGKALVYRYFDGKTAYIRHERQDLEPLKAFVWRADAKTRQYEGEGVFLERPVKANATVSAAYAQVTLRMTDGMFPPLPEDAWYAVKLLDENQRPLRAQNSGGENVSTMTVSFDGTGHLPQFLTFEFKVESEKGEVIDPALQQTMTLQLRPAE